jgi:2-polyprenyl-3-methyl-5-hydroxy-6-metoxy-1,4-benzoquinol methylase
MQSKELYGLNIDTQWEQILEIHVLNLAKEYRPDWYRWRLTNNYERAVFLKGDPVLPREASRYLWANANLYGDNVLEIGCSTGYGTQFLPKSFGYLGIDYDPVIINVAEEQNWGQNRLFQNADINYFSIPKTDTIIAFEVIEHLENGLEVVEKLKKCCKRLLISVPLQEPKGFWGEHHKLHNLTQIHFPGFKFNYISENGFVTDYPQPITEQNRCNLMLCRFDNE